MLYCPSLHFIAYKSMNSAKLNSRSMLHHYVFIGGLRRRSSADGLQGFGFESLQGHGCLPIVSLSYVVTQRSLRRADHSSRGFLPIVVHLCVWSTSRNFVNEKALAHWGLSRQIKRIYTETKNTNYRRRNVALHVAAQDVKSDFTLGRKLVLCFTGLI
jgi:hypothetical protein